MKRESIATVLVLEVVVFREVVIAHLHCTKSKSVQVDLKTETEHSKILVIQREWIIALYLKLKLFPIF